MKSFRTFILILMLALGAVAEEANDGALAPMATDDFDGFYLASTFKIPTSKIIYIEDVPVSFSDKWLHEYRTSTSTYYQNRIKEKYGKTLKEQLAIQLEEKGWQVTKERTSKSLILSPQIVDLNIYAPNVVGIRQVIVRNAGQAKMELTFKTPDGMAFMKIVDHRITRENIGSPIVANRASNFRYFRMLMELWSEKSIEYLENVFSLVREQAEMPTK